ncbi:TIGR03067 domain-containing protein [bacterium]|nr:TIGR03067 domain-containing protein [bacterium]
MNAISIHPASWLWIAVERLGWVLVHSLWQFALLGLLAAIAIRLLRQHAADTRYLVLGVVLVVTVMAPLATWMMLPETSHGSMQSANADLDPGLEFEPQVMARSAGVDSRPLPEPSLISGHAEPEGSVPAHIPPTVPLLSPDDSASDPMWSERVTNWLRPWLVWIVAAWSAGVALCSLRPLLGWYTLRRLRRVGVSPVPDEVADTFQRMSQRLGLRRGVRILNSTLAQVPVVVGYVRPVILLPLSLITTIPAGQLDAILAHELAHVRRHDFLVNLLQTLVETVFFYHPAVWWMSSRLRAERENCCDDMVVKTLGNRVEYGRALLAIEELRGGRSVLAIGATDGSLLARVRRIVGLPATTAPGMPWPVLSLVSLCAIALGVMSVSGWQNVADANAVTDESDDDAVVGTADEDDNPQVLTPAFRLPGHYNLMDVCFDNGDRELVSVSAYNLATVRRCDVAGRTLISEINLTGDKPSRPFRPETFKLSGDGRRILAATDEYVGIWDTSTGGLLRKLSYPTKQWEYDCIGKLDCTPDLSVIVGHLTTQYSRTTLVYDAHLIIWDGKTGEVLKMVVDRRATELVSIDLSTDGKRLATTNGGGAKVWETDTGRLLHSFPNDNAGRSHPDPDVKGPYYNHVWSVQLSPDGKQLAVGDILGVRLWDVDSGKLLHLLESAYRYGRGMLVYSGDGQLLARTGTSSKESGVVPIWSTRTGRKLFDLETASNSGAFSDDNKQFAVGLSQHQMSVAVFQLDGTAADTEPALPAGDGNTPGGLRFHHRGKEAQELISQWKPVWGDGQQGIQYGIALVSEQRQFHTGQRVPLMVFFRNVSDRPLQVDVRPDFFWNVPKLTDDNGAELQLERVALLGTVPHYRETLAAGEAFGAIYLSIGMGENPRPGQQDWAPYWKSPVAGSYRLTHSVAFKIASPDADRDDQSDDWKPGQLTTGALDFEVTAGPPPAAQDQAGNSPKDAATLEVERLQGTWAMDLCDSEVRGFGDSQDVVKQWRWAIHGNEVKWTRSDSEVWKLKFSLEPGKTPKEIDFTYLDGPHKGAKCLGMYEWGGVDGKMLLMSLQDPGATVARPKSISMKSGGQTSLIFLEPLPLDETEKELASLQGTWKFEIIQTDGWPKPIGKGPDRLGRGDQRKWVVKGNEITWTSPQGEEVKLSFTIDPSKAPKHIDVTFLSGPHKGQSCAGIYERGGVGGVVLWLCLTDPGSKAPRPTRVSYATQEGRTMIGLIRVDPPREPAEESAATIARDQSIALADAVRDFNAENRQLGRGLEQPVLTEAEVLSFLKRDEWKPESLPLNEQEAAEFKAVVESKRLPKDAYFQVYEEERAGMFVFKHLWQVRLMLPAVGRDGFVGLTIRNTELAEEKIDPKQVAWGKPDADGLSLGIYLSPKKAEYALGDRVRLRLFVRNEGKQPVETTWANTSHPMPDDLTVTDETGAEVSVRIGHESWALPWVSGFVAGGLVAGEVHTFTVPYQIGLGGNGSTNKLIGRVIDARPGQTLQLRVRQPNGNNRTRSENESLPESGDVRFQVAAAVRGKPVPQAQGFRTTARPERDGLMVGEPGWILFEVHNDTDADKRAIVGGDYRNALGRPNSFKVDVFDAAGKPVPQPDSGIDFGGMSYPMPIAAKGSTVFKLFVPHWATITEPGRYRITIRRDLDLVAGEKDGGRDAFALKPETVPVAAETTLTIVPADDATFGSLIEQLGPVLLGEPVSPDLASRLRWVEPIGPQHIVDPADEQERADQILRAISRNGRPDERAVTWYLKLLAQPNVSRKRSALRFLGTCQSEAALDAIIRSLEITADDIGDATNREAAGAVAENIQFGAAGALSMFATRNPDSARATEKLLALADHPHMPIRLTVLHFAAQNKTAKAREIIDSLTTDKDVTLANEAKRYQILLREEDAKGAGQEAASKDEPGKDEQTALVDAEAAARELEADQQALTLQTQELEKLIASRETARQAGGDTVQLEVDIALQRVRLAELKLRIAVAGNRMRPSSTPDDVLLALKRETLVHWGRPVNGVQIGLERVSIRDTYTAGEAVEFRRRVRNTGSEPLETTLTFRPGSGSKFKLFSTGRFAVTPGSRTDESVAIKLPPGAEQPIAGSEFRIDTKNLQPGRYNVESYDRFQIGDAGDERRKVVASSPNWHISSMYVPPGFEVVASNALTAPADAKPFVLQGGLDISWGSPVQGLQGGLRYTRGLVKPDEFSHPDNWQWKLGDHVEAEVLVRNLLPTPAPVTFAVTADDRLVALQTSVHSVHVYDNTGALVRRRGASGVFRSDGYEPTGRERTVMLQPGEAIVVARTKFQLLAEPDNLNDIAKLPRVEAILVKPASRYSFSTHLPVRGSVAADLRLYTGQTRLWIRNENEPSVKPAPVVTPGRGRIALSYDMPGAARIVIGSLSGNGRHLAIELSDAAKVQPIELPAGQYEVYRRVRLTVGSRTKDIACNRQIVTVTAGNNMHVTFKHANKERHVATGQWPDLAANGLAGAFLTVHPIDEKILNVGDPDGYFDFEIDRETIAAATCGPDGKFSLEPLPVGRYAVVLRAYREAAPDGGGLSLPYFVGVNAFQILSENRGVHFYPNTFRIQPRWNSPHW